MHQSVCVVPLTADMNKCLRSLLLLTLWIECKGDTVTQSEGEVTATQGTSAEIKCVFDTSDSYPYLFWYKQEMGDSPQYMLRKTKTGPTTKSPDFNKDRYEAEIDGNSFVLKIQDVDVTDSAVYYCALNGAGYKVIFGTGTSLTVHTEDYEPNYYQLGEGDTKVCLATDFSRINKVKDKAGFNETEAALINEEPKPTGLYNQVFLMDKFSCTESDGGSCDDSLQPDPQVNLMSLTVLGLRVLFVKTVAFNIVMTMRLWLRT